MGIGVSKQAAAGPQHNNGQFDHHHNHHSGPSSTTKPVISPANSSLNGSSGGGVRNSNASFISTGFGMDTSGGTQLLHHHHVRQPSVRRRYQPMPDRQELDQRFAKVLVSIRYVVKKVSTAQMLCSTALCTYCTLCTSERNGFSSLSISCMYFTKCGGVLWISSEILRPFSLSPRCPSMWVSPPCR